MSLTKDSSGIERLKFLYAVIGGIPGARVNLSSWRQARQSPRVADEKLLHQCGTTGCAVGWACAHPEFQALGLEFRGTNPLFKTEGKWYDGWDAVEEFFNIGSGAAQHLFKNHGTAYNDDWKDNKKRSHKRLILMRIRNYLYGHGAITSERVEELKVYEAELEQREAETPSSN